MAKKNIRINFINFWGGFDPYNNYFIDLLKEEFFVEISNNPDYLFYSVFGNDHMRFKCKKIFYTGENIPPDFSKCDYAFTFDYLEDSRNFRLPHYLLYPGYYDLVNKKIDAGLVNRKFCNFLVNNPNCIERNSFFKELSKYKTVDSGGRLFNNLNYEVNGKRSFQSQYKFSIAFENNAYRPQHIGYSTEKIMEPMLSNSIPIYWGNPRIDLEFNTKSFINFYDFNSQNQMIDYIIFLDQNDDEYLSKLKEPWIFENQIIKLEDIKKFLYNIFN